MRELFFANCRMLVDDAIACHESMRYLSGFEREMPYEHTFMLRLGDPSLIDGRYEEALGGPVVTETTGFELRRSREGWSFVSKAASPEGRAMARQVLECDRWYRDMTLYCMGEGAHQEAIQPSPGYFLPFKTMVRVACGIGMAFTGGLSLHASLVAKDGYGVLFVGPSGMGKSTQARLWERHLGAEVINGDSPAIYERDGEWFAAGIPWDGKDQIYVQRNLPIRAVVVLEQAPENEIRRMGATEAMRALLQQVMHPVWDGEAMDRVTGLLHGCATTVPFWHLRNLPDEGAAMLTHETIDERVV